MIGYKLAVGVCKDEGFFPVVVKLEIPEDAKVVKPIAPGFRKVYKQELPDGYHFTLSTKDFPKYRTDKCKVLNIYALDEKEHPNWNGVGYSLYRIIQYLRYNCSDITEYHEKMMLVSDLDLNQERSCSKGIHFFETEEVARAYYCEDEDEWFLDGITLLNEELKNLSFYYRAKKANYTVCPHFLPVNNLPEVLYKRYTGATDISCFSERYL